MWWYSGNIKLTLLILGGGGAAILVLAAIAYLLLRSGRALGMQAGSIWRLALAGMRRRRQENTMTILVFCFSIMIIVNLIIDRTALIEEWRAQLPVGAPNQFIINIAPAEVAPIGQMLRENNIDSQPLYPLVSGRIIAVNDENVRDRDRQRRRPRDQRAPRSGSNRNLTWAARMPDDNRIIAGEWWQQDYEGEPMVSLEKDLAETNDLVVGDVLTFSIRERELKARVGSIRSVSWDNMRPNFYIIFSPHALDEFPTTSMTSFFLEKDQKMFLNQLLREFPTITVFEVDAIIEQIQAIIAQVSLAIELVLVLILVAGMLVLLASIQASMDERFHQQAILRTLGASQKLVMGSLLIEFSVLGLFAGLLATLGAEITVFGLQTQIFELEYTVHPWLWLLGPIIGMVLIGVVGIGATRSLVKTAPVAILRELA